MITTLRQTALALGCLLPIFTAGCDDGRPQLAPVSGTVTYQGKPLAEAGITFAPSQARAAFGMVREGRIESVTTFEAEDGVVVGTAKVGVQATTNLGKITGPHHPLIPQHYFDPATSGIEVDVQVDDPNEFLIELVD